MQVQEIQLAAQSSANFSPHYEGVLREMRRNRAGVRTPPTEAETLTTSCAPGATSSLSDGGPSKNLGTPRYSPRMAPDEYVVVIKPRETCNLKQYRGTDSIGNAIRAAISQRSGNAEAAPNLAHKYSLHPLWEQNLVVVGTKEECVLHTLLSLEQLRLTDRTINVQAYLKATDNMGKDVIRLANTFTTDYILENTTSPDNPIIGARRLGSTNVVTLTFEHSCIPRLVFFLNEATLVQHLDTARTCAPRLCRRLNGVRAKLDWTQPHECHPSCVLCGGPHAAGSRDCPRRYRQPASAKPAGRPNTRPQHDTVSPAAQPAGPDVNSGASGPQVNMCSGELGIKDCEISPAASGTTGSDVCSTQRSSSTSQKQASIADMVDKALEQKFSSFTATITQTIEQSIFSHISALEARNTQRFHELTAPYITQMESIIAKYNRRIGQLNEGKHTMGVNQLSGRRDMPATALHTNLDSDDASTTQHDG
ncbi:hypothetical protein HPB52_021957 [Rhipicephalus sanguineus]|uniref:Uncharacterized protein n=1 Tax=Rhipicephalus sanguineus TaxID=34632 RepID=A0A9D4Q8G2_RHISA|nr:hypothetical protein HPB52_021957 [Rhipicephalus sanguineus]